MLQETIPGTRDVATRWRNAEIRGEATLAEIAGLTEEQGQLAWRVYVHIGAARADMIMGQPEWRHGAYLDAELIRRAVEKSADLLAQRASPWRKRR